MPCGFRAREYYKEDDCDILNPDFFSSALQSSQHHCYPTPNTFFLLAPKFHDAVLRSCYCCCYGPCQRGLGSELYYRLLEGLSV
jgi:hypothetical protein